jgi:hypothetical protein
LPGSGHALRRAARRRLRAVLEGIFFKAFLTTFFGTLLGAALERLGDVIVALALGTLRAITPIRVAYCIPI